MSKNFPMPNDTVGDYIVVASVWLHENDEDGWPDSALCVLLAAQSPFFRVAEVTVKEHRILWEHVHVNIVPAVRDYEQNGGDW